MIFFFFDRNRTEQNYDLIYNDYFFFFLIWETIDYIDVTYND